MPMPMLYAMLLSVLLAAQTAPDPVPQEVPVSIIFDTDMGPDFDDAGALAVLHALADSGEARILATISSNQHPTTVPAIDAINTYFGRPDLPIGILRSGGVNDTAENGWAARLAEAFPHDQTAEDVPDAVTLYRHILAEQPDTSVVVVTVGFLTNLRNLLASEPDSISDLGGRELVAQKVKRLVAMAGAFPEGREFNIYRDAVAGQEALAAWPTPILFSGFEIGEAIMTGNRLVREGNAESPVHAAYEYNLRTYADEPLAEGRHSWDQTAVLAAVRGPAPYFSAVPGRIAVAGDGSNTWTDAQGGSHAYLVQEAPVEETARVIEDLMMHTPSER